MMEAIATLWNRLRKPPSDSATDGPEVEIIRREQQISAEEEWHHIPDWRKGPEGGYTD
jgi:hypothetical protein